MATTIHAGPSWVAGVQAAANTAGTAGQIRREQEDHESEQKLLAANLKRVEALTQADEIENQIRLDERGRLKQQASINSFLAGGMADQAGFGPEPVLDNPEMFEGATPQQMAALGRVMQAGRQMRREQEEIGQIGEIIQRELVDHEAGSGPKMPGYAEQMAQLGELLQTIQPGGDVSPREVGAQVQELQRRNLEFQVRQDAQAEALKEVDAAGLGVKGAQVKALIRMGEFDEAADLMYALSKPEGYQHTRKKAQAEVVDEQVQQLEDRLLDKILEEEIDPETPEGQAEIDAYWKKAAAAHPWLFPQDESGLQPITDFNMQGVEGKSGVKAAMPVNDYGTSGKKPKKGKKDEQALKMMAEGATDEEIKAFLRGD